jgi:hypothetical protein
MTTTSGGRANESRFQNRTAAADVDPTRQEIAAAQLLHHQLDARAPDLDVVRDDLRDLVLAFHIEAPGVVDLQRLGARERQVEPVGEALREGPAAEREHARALDPTLADERDVRRAATDIDEQGTCLADLIRTQDASNGVRLGDHLEQLQVELARDALQGSQMDEWGERVEDPDLHVAALEADGIGQRVAVDRGADDCRMDEPNVDVR